MTSRSLTHIAQAPPPAGATAWESLLHPLTPEAFRADYWQRRPVHLTGWPGRLSGVFDRASLRRALALASQHESGLTVRVSDDHEGDDGAAGAHVLIDAADVSDQLRGGSSVCVDPIDRADPVVAKLATAFKDELRHAGPVSVKCYFSTPGYGFNAHFDAHVVTTLQIEGSKRWRVSRAPAVPFPLSSAFLDATGEIHYIGRRPRSLRSWETPPVDRSDFAEVMLRPGDVLCLPAGTWHEAKAAGEPSLALNFSFASLHVLGPLTALVKSRLDDDESWRAGVPAGTGMREYVDARVRDLVRVLGELALDPDLASDVLSVRSAPVAQDQPAAVAHAAASAASAAFAGRRMQCMIGVADANRAAAWYERVLGGDVVSTIPEYGWVEVSTGVPGVTLGLTEMPTTAANRGAVLDFEVDNLERIRGVLATNGVTVTEQPTEIAGVARVLMAHDLDGNRLMFFEPHN